MAVDLTNPDRVRFSDLGHEECRQRAAALASSQPKLVGAFLKPGDALGPRARPPAGFTTLGDLHTLRRTEPARKAAREPSPRERVAAALRDGARTAPEVAPRAGLPPDDALSVLDRLIDNGAIRCRRDALGAERPEVAR